MERLSWGWTASTSNGNRALRPLTNAIKSFTESAIYTANSRWYGLRGQSATNRRSFPEGDVPQQLLKSTVDAHWVSMREQ